MDAHELLFPPGATRHDWVFDGALAGGLILLTVMPYWVMREYLQAPLWWMILLALMVLPVVLRRHSPLLMLAGVTLAWFTQLASSDSLPAPTVVMPIVAYSVARWVPGPAARIVVVVGAIGATVGPARWMADDFAYGLSLRASITYLVVASVCLGLIVTPYAIGRRVRESSEAHRDRVVAAEERYNLLLAEREQQGRLAESRARTMIARELHDIVAHSLSVMIVQAEGGRALAEKRPEAAIAALDTIAETGREALQEMRRIVGVLRAEPDGSPTADYTPAPTLADIPDLVHRATDRATLRILGLPPRVSPAMELTVYRVVQEALTNFLKHAGPKATASVTLAYGYREITIEVVDNGPGPVSQPGNAGHGLRGMAERVGSMGGRLEARPLPKGGFAVLAVLPINLPQGAMR